MGKEFAMTQGSERPLYWWVWLSILGRVAMQHGEPKRTVMAVPEGKREAIDAVNDARNLARGVFVERETRGEPSKNRKRRRAEQARARR